MANKASKPKQAKTASRSKKVKMSDLQVTEGGSVKGGYTQQARPTGATSGNVTGKWDLVKAKGA